MPKIYEKSETVTTTADVEQLGQVFSYIDGALFVALQLPNQSPGARQVSSLLDAAGVAALQAALQAVAEAWVGRDGLTLQGAKP